MGKTISKTIAEYCYAFTLESVPDNVLSYAKYHILDSIGCAVAACREEHIPMIAHAIKKSGSSGTARLWGSDETAAYGDAAIYNSALIHALDFDDTHAASIIHPSTSVVSAALTYGETAGCSGRDVLEAIILGYEVLIRLGNAAHGAFHNIGFHPTGLLAPFAAVCVIGKLKHLPADVIENALGICGSQAASLQEYLQDGTWNKKIHSGWSVHCACFAIALAEEGFSGSKKVFEGTYGLFNTHVGNADGLISEFSDLGKRWVTDEIAFKFYPTCHYTHSFADLLRRIIREQSISYEDIKSVQCLVEPRCRLSVVNPEEQKRDPVSEYQMRFSIFYALASIAVNAELTLKDISLDKLKDVRIHQFIDRIEVKTDSAEEVPGHFPGHIVVILTDGRVFDIKQPYERGCKQNPAQVDEVIQKFEENTADYLGREGRNRIIKYVLGIETEKNLDDLVRAIRIVN